MAAPSGTASPLDHVGDVVSLLATTSSVRERTYRSECSHARHLATPGMRPVAPVVVMVMMTSLGPGARSEFLPSARKSLRTNGTESAIAKSLSDSMARIFALFPALVTDQLGGADASNDPLSQMAAMMRAAVTEFLIPGASNVLVLVVAVPVVLSMPCAATLVIVVFLPTAAVVDFADSTLVIVVVLAGFWTLGDLAIVHLGALDNLVLGLLPSQDDLLPDGSFLNDDGLRVGLPDDDGLRRGRRTREELGRLGILFQRVRLLWLLVNLAFDGVLADARRRRRMLDDVALDAVLVHIMAGRCRAVDLALDVAVLVNIAAGGAVVVSVDYVALADNGRVGVALALALAGDDAGLLVVIVIVRVVVGDAVAADDGGGGFARGVRLEVPVALALAGRLFVDDGHLGLLAG